MNARAVSEDAQSAFDVLGDDPGFDSYRDFERSRYVTEDGTSLRVFEYGPRSAPAVVLVNPIGVPILLASRLMRLLGARFRTICWEQRGCRNDPEYLPDTRNDYAAFLSDLVQVVRSRVHAGPHALVGICSGASLALKALAEGLVEPASVVLVSPAVRFKAGYSESLFDTAVVPYMRLIAAGDGQLAQCLLDIKAANASQGVAPASADEGLIEAADRWSLRCLESLRVYARTIRSFADQALDEELAGIRRKVHILSAVDDQTVCIHSVRRLARLLVHAELTEYERGGHFLLFLNESVGPAVRQILEDEMAGRGEQGHKAPRLHTGTVG